MSFLDKVGEFLYGNFSTEYEQNAQLHEDVAAIQDANNKRRYQESKIGLLEYLKRDNLISDAADDTSDARDKDKSWLNLISGVPWWVWLLLLVALFHWLGGFTWLKNKSRGALAR